VTLNIRALRELDWLMIGLALAISLIGVFQIFSATQGTRWQSAWWKQVLYVAVGLALMWLIARVDYHVLMGRSLVLYWAVNILLLVVLVAGAKVFGSRRWIPLAFGFHLQVSEFAKLVIVLLVARYLTATKGGTLQGRELLRLGGLVALPMFLVMREPDLGTALTYLPIVGVGVLLAGLRWRHAAVLGVLAVLVPALAYQFALRPYQRARVDSFLDPESDPHGAGYQVIQSKIAVGSGRLLGRGEAKGYQTRLQFLPVPHTDFIFATYAEEHGFAGVAFVFVLYFLLIMQIVQNAQAALDRSGTFICMGVAALLLFHILVNAGMVVGQMPITGIPLPLMSNGGSGTLSIFLMLGLVNNVRLQRAVS
jgi:rod shape determining protein RodA